MNNPQFSGILLTELNRARAHNLISYTLCEIPGDGQKVYIDFHEPVRKDNILKFQQYIETNYHYKTLAFPDSRGMIVFNEGILDGLFTK